MERLLLRPTEAADLIGVGRSTIYELIATGEVPSLKIGSSVRVPVDGLREWIAARVRLSEPPQ
jgi:excisionase family DNA binding protein